MITNDLIKWIFIIPQSIVIGIVVVIIIITIDQNQPHIRSNIGIILGTVGFLLLIEQIQIPIWKFIFRNDEYVQNAIQTQKLSPFSTYTTNLGTEEIIQQKLVFSYIQRMGILFVIVGLLCQIDFTFLPSPLLTFSLLTQDIILLSFYITLIIISIIISKLHVCDIKKSRSLRSRVFYI